jgi:hypothetical protein
MGEDMIKVIVLSFKKCLDEKERYALKIGL